MAEKRSQLATFLNTGTSASPTYNLIGDGVAELELSYNPQSTTERFINQDSATTEVTDYQINASVSQQVIKGDPIYDFINELRKKRAVMSDAHTDIINVNKLDTPISEGVYPAEKQKVSIQIDSFGGAASDPLSIGYTINYVGDPEQVNFNITSKTIVTSGGE